MSISFSVSWWISFFMWQNTRQFWILLLTALNTKDTKETDSLGHKWKHPRARILWFRRSEVLIPRPRSSGFREGWEKSLQSGVGGVEAESLERHLFFIAWEAMYKLGWHWLQRGYTWSQIALDKRQCVGSCNVKSSGVQAGSLHGFRVHFYAIPSFVASSCFVFRQVLLCRPNTASSFWLHIHTL